MKNFTNNFKQFTSRLSARWLIMALMLLVGTSSAWAWSYKAANDSWNCRGGNSNWLTSQTYYTSPTGSTTKTIDVVMLENPGSGFNILQQDHCNNDNNDCLYVGLTSSASSSTSTIVRGTAYWNNALYSTYTVVIPEGKIYIKPTNGTAIEMQLSKTYSNSSLTTKRLETCTYTAELSLSSAKTFDLYAADPGATITAEWGMPDAGKPSSVRLNYTNLVSDYQYVKVTYNLITNQITFEEMTPPCDPPAAPNFGSESSAEYCYGDVVSFPTINGVTLKWYDEETGGNIVESPETNVGSTNYYAAAVGECESTDRTAYTITINPVPSITNVSDVTLCSSSTPISVENLITETGATADYSATIGLYAENGDEITGPININTQTTTTYKLKASTQTCSSDFVSFSLTVNSLPAAPSLISPDPVCEDATVQLPTEGLKWYDAETGGTEVQNTAIKVTGTYWAAALQNECESATRTRYDVTVNPKPTISISGKGTAVLYEDVTLTATATDGATVKWYEGGVEKGEGLTYVVTSETATSKTVTAQAFLNGCESNPASHLVNFSAENCASDNKIIIECISTSEDALYCYAFYGNNKTEIFGAWPGTQGNANGNTYTWTIEDKDDVTIIFNAGNNTNQTDDIEDRKKGKKYYYTFDSSISKDNTPENYELIATEDILSITAPAVKTVSVTSEEGSGVVNFTGQIIKTGCAATSSIYYGYQFKKEGEDWPTTGVEASNTPVKGKLIPLTNASETALYYQFSANVENLENGIYYFRAYIINGYNFTNGNYDQGVYYGIDIPVTVSTKKYPIENLQIQYANDKGDVLQDQNVTYCVGDNAYIKLIYDGSKLKPEEDEINISSTLENTFTLVEGEADDLYTFVVKGNETITVIAKNEENTVQGIDPATNSIDISTYVQPQTPSITLPEGMAVVCSNGVGATITVNEPQEGITYSLYIDGVAEAAQTKTPTEGTLQFTEIKTAGTYYVTAVNPSCPNNIAKSLDSKSIEVIDASANTIAIEPDEDTTNPWVPVKLKVTKNSVYDYTLVCKQDVTDVTESVVINKKDDIYTIKFPKPEGADITDDGQVEFDDIEYTVIVSLDGNVECGTTSATSEITLTQLVEDCTNN